MMNASLGDKIASPASLVTVGFSSLAHRSMSWLRFVQSCTDVVNALQTFADVLSRPEPPTCVWRCLFL